jgi:hypothetical protein
MKMSDQPHAPATLLSWKLPTVPTKLQAQLGPNGTGTSHFTEQLRLILF